MSAGQGSGEPTIPVLPVFVGGTHAGCLIDINVKGRQYIEVGQLPAVRIRPGDIVGSAIAKTPERSIYERRPLTIGDFRVDVFVDTLTEAAVAYRQALGIVVERATRR